MINFSLENKGWNKGDYIRGLFRKNNVVVHSTVIVFSIDRDKEMFICPH